MATKSAPPAHGDGLRRLHQQSSIRRGHQEGKLVKVRYLVLK